MASDIFRETTQDRYNFGGCNYKMSAVAIPTLTCFAGIWLGESSYAVSTSKDCGRVGLIDHRHRDAISEQLAHISKLAFLNLHSMPLGSLEDCSSI